MGQFAEWVYFRRGDSRLGRFFGAGEFSEWVNSGVDLHRSGKFSRLGQFQRGSIPERGRFT